MDPNQARIDSENSEFWNELCGTHFAKSLGVTDNSIESLRKFDRAFFELYPYVVPLLRPERMRGKKVLEIGLGYGTVGQRLAESDALYTGLDIARNPVDHMNWRLRQTRLPGRAIQGSAHAMPFPDASFDYLVSIGCFHHTGNVQKCLDESHRVLKPGGTAIVMVYNKFSLRQWRSWPRKTFLALFQGLARRRNQETLTERQRAQYDANSQAQSAPETVLLSIGELKRMLAAFDSVAFQKHNADPFLFWGRILFRREALLKNVARVLGLDIYVEATKAPAQSHRMAA